MLAKNHRLGSYKIVRLLGEGGMGAVYEARQEPLDRRVALKILHPQYAGNRESVARFFNEAKVLSRLSHPSIVQLSDFGQSPDGTTFLVMEYLRGESLAQRLRTLSERGEKLATLSALQLGWQIADVLAVAHAEGIAHRDLKPDNLMLIADSVAPSGERVKILDFGIAKLTGEHDGSVLKTDTQAIMGTPLYMSPEQCAGAGGVTAKTDVYSLGCVLYEALAGRPPFCAEGGGQVIGMHLFKEPPALTEHAPGLHPAVVTLIHRLLTKDKSERPDMSQAADELGRLLAKLYKAGPATRSRPVARAESDAQLPLSPEVPGTTLGGSTGQNSHKVGRFGRIGAIVAAAALVTVSSTLLFRGVLGRRPSQPSRREAAFVPGAVAPANTTAPPTAPGVTWSIDTDPPGARVLDEHGTLLGETPWIHSPHITASHFMLRLRRTGFIDVTVTLDSAHNETQRIKLTPLPPKELPKQPPKRTAPPSPKNQPPPQRRSGIGYDD